MRQLVIRCFSVVALCTAILAHGAPGELDTTFGLGSGKVISPIGSTQYGARAVALQPDGKIVVAGTCAAPSGFAFCIVRYLSNGALDVSFNGNGTVTTAIRANTGYANAVAIQSDGKIVAGGSCSNGVTFDFCVARYLPSGTLDAEFGTAGTVVTPIGLGVIYAIGLILQPDAKIVLAGTCFGSNNREFCVARYLPNGALDTTFNATGNVITSITAGGDDGFALAQQPDGALIVAGRCYGNSLISNFCLARYRADGTLDTTFNSTGTIVTQIGSSESIGHALVVQPDRKIIVAGVCRGATANGFCVARYHADGTLDTTFNATGTLIAQIGSDDYAHAIGLQPDGKIVVAGHCLVSGTWDLCVARFQPDGSADTTFNGTGTVLTRIGSGENNGLALSLQSNGKIVVAGRCRTGNNSEFCLARYDGGPFGYKNCSLDIDGDGVVRATTDALIGARIALGLSGSAAIGGITFAPHATRSTWPLIRDYLVSQCGMSIVP